MGLPELKEFRRDWSGKEKTVGDVFRKIFGKERPIRYRLASARYRINSMVRKLEVYGEKLKSRDQELFNRVVDALMAKDQIRATMYANEVAEIRKIAKAVFLTQVALEQISLRLESVQELGDIAVNLAPVVELIRDLRIAVKDVLPEIGIELGEVHDLLNETMIEIGEVVGVPGTGIAASAEARKILEEARVVAEQRMKEMFPSLPSAVSIPQPQATQVEQSH
ncbi:MAG: Snf7 family protein [Sulfolobales archaeon]|nr:Snf7 family protein [Sulfolobales archaeon]MDW8010814.1 Snf7 family protein [Sulfolobales archaeon]